MSEMRLVPNELGTPQKYITVLIREGDFGRSVYATIAKEDGAIIRIYVKDGDVRRDVTTSYEEAMSSGDSSAKEVTKMLQDFHKNWKETNEAEERSNG